MTLDDIRTLLAAPAAWSEILRTSSEGCKCSQCAAVHTAIAAYCDERARNLAQLLECDAEADRERGEAVRALLAELARGPEDNPEHYESDAVGAVLQIRWWDDLVAAIAAVRAHYPGGA